MDDAANDTVLVTTGGGIARVTLNRPDARNALNLPMCHALLDTFRKLENDEDVRVVIVSGSGPVFCAGADLKERKGKSAAWVRDRRLAGFAAYDAIARCKRPTIMLAQGGVIGSGGEIALSCDIVVASTAAFFRFPEPQWGTVGATQRLQRAIGKRRAKDLLFTGRDMPADEAHTLGLVARLAEPERLEETGNKIARKIAAASPLAMELTKQAVENGEETDLSTGMRIELAAIDRLLAGDEWKKGIDAFTSKHGDK